MRGPGVARKLNGKFATKTERQAEALGSNLNGLGVLSKAEAAKRSKAAKKAKPAADAKFAAPDANFGESEKQAPGLSIDYSVRLNAICDHCNKGIYGVRFWCFDCKDFDLCSKCHHADRHKHPYDHRFKDIQHVYADKERKNVLDDDVSCCCGTNVTENTVLCENCSDSFHPRCSGKAKYTRHSDEEHWAERPAVLVCRMPEPEAEIEDQMHSVPEVVELEPGTEDLPDNPLEARKIKLARNRKRKADETEAEKAASGLDVAASVQNEFADGMDIGDDAPPEEAEYPDSRRRKRARVSHG